MGLIMVVCWIGLLVFIGTRSQYDLEFYLFLGWVGILVAGFLVVALREFA